MLSVNSWTSTPISSSLNTAYGSMVQILFALWPCHSQKICNAHLFLKTVDFGIELITQTFSSWKVLGIWNLELDLSFSHRKLNFLNYNKLADSQMAHSIQIIFITFYSYCLINKMKQKQQTIIVGNFFRSYTKNSASCFIRYSRHPETIKAICLWPHAFICF